MCCDLLLWGRTRSRPKVLRRDEELNDYVASLPDEDLERIWTAMWQNASMQEWEEQAREGLPTSARAPKDLDVETPPKVSVLGFDVPEETPEKVLQPFKKAQLIAQKKLEQQARKNKSAEKTEKTEEKPAKPGSKPSAKPGVKPGKKPSPKSKPSQTEGKGGKKAKGTQAPLRDALSKFLKANKAEGKTHREIMKEWMDSAEREAIVSKFDQSERKRRRY
eukprot:s1012_g15.t1